MTVWKPKVAGWTRYYKGEITRVNSDGTYDIRFDDGERKRGVRADQIKGGSSDRDEGSSGSSSREGDRVEAKVAGWTRYYKGEITRVNSDGTYDIRFDDGERKRGVRADQIKGGSSDRDEGSSGSSSHREGDRVEAKVAGWTRYYKGEITRVNSDGTYDIRFDDGERKRGVRADQIKGGSSDRDERSSGSSSHREGDRVEAKVAGWTRYYKGEITRVNSDGTYDIRFDDGERKRGVRADQIKGGSSDRDEGSSGTSSHREGDRVEAKVAGWTRYYKGEITRVNSDGTYDIRFDDGERKRGVRAEQIKGGSSDRDDRSSGSSSHREGDRVEAKVAGWTRYYKGEITRVNSDGTYDIRFDDGERKRGVRADQIRGGSSDREMNGLPDHRAIAKVTV